MNEKLAEMLAEINDNMTIINPDGNKTVNKRKKDMHRRRNTMNKQERQEQDMKHNRQTKR